MFLKVMSKTPTWVRRCLLGVSALAGLSTWAMDTDIFSSGGSAGTPNVLIVIDNTSNWSRNNEKFPDGAGGTITQGQAETAAIRTVIDALPGNVNVGLMEFATGGNANDTGGYIRQAIVPMGLGQGSAAATNRTNFRDKLTTIYNDINGPLEKINAGTPYGDLMWDVYNYYSGATPSVRSEAVNAERADSNGYTTRYTQFKAPISADKICAANHIIFIGNPPANGPTNDSSTNTAALTTANGAAFSQLALPPYSETTTNVATKLGYSSACYSSVPTEAPTDYASVCPGGTSATYESCGYDATDSKATMNACPTGQSRYSVIATTPNTSSSSTVVSAPTTATGASACYASAAAASADTGGMTCPASTSTTSGNTITTTSYSCSYAIGATTGSACASSVVVNQGASLVGTATTSSCYSNDNARGNDVAGLVCPSSLSSTNGGVTTVTSYSCSYSAAAGSSSGCSNGKNHFNVTQNASPTITTTSTNAHYVVTKTQTQSVTTATAADGSTVTTLGNSAACYSSTPSGTPSEYACPAGATCSYSGTTSSAMCPTGKNVYQVVGNLNTIITAPTGGTAVTDTATYNADEWARFLNAKGFAVSGTTTKAHVRTHAIDVYGVQPNGVQSSLLNNMSHYGGGGYYTATNPDQIKAALESIFGEINATNSVFASAALPISATQRAQNDNQVYIGMFRPDQQSLPRWMGNLKRFQLGTTAAGQTDLVDAQSIPIAAINSSTGFLTPCAQSWWTTDEGNYWATVDAANGTVTPRVFFTQTLNTNPGKEWDTLGDDTVLAEGGCLNKPAYSDKPDGAIVEKGGVAQMMRKATSRKVLTLSGSTLVDFNTTNVTSLSGDVAINNNIVNFILGKDVTGEINGTASSQLRPSIHGAVIHSRPQPVDFGGANGVKIYYGSNDGTFRAIDADTGSEDWAFVPTESYPSLRRLMDNTPAVQSPSPTPPSQLDSGGTPKDFYFDGSTGLYQSGIGTGSKTWIFPAMRRGGRMLHAFDVSNPAVSPVFKWKVGCPHQTDDDECTSDNIKAIGQTWSTPNAVFLPGYSTTVPVLVVGGGYDTCEDADSASPACTSPKGAGVYVLDASTGQVIKFLATDRSVAADVALIDANRDGVVDFAYAADTGGNIYRVNFSNPSTFAKLEQTIDASKNEWTITKVAFTGGGSRKFLFPPALLAVKNQVYVAIGSGDREHPIAQSYPYTTPVLNRAYVYRDDLASAAYNLDNLTNNTAADKNTCEATGLQTTGNKGWLLDLNAYGQGEQTVTSALISAGLVFFSTNRPTPAEVCGTGLGEARGYALNLFNGSGGIGVTPSCGGDRSAVLVGGGLAPSPVAGVVTVDGVVQNVVIGVVKLDGSTSTPFGGQKLNPNISKTRTRIFWKTNTDSK